MDGAELWLDEEFRRRYPLTAQRLREMAEQEKADSAYRKYMETLRSLYALADPFEKEVREFGRKDLLYAPHTHEMSGEVEKLGIGAAPRPVDEARGREAERQRNAERPGNKVPSGYQDEQD